MIAKVERCGKTYGQRIFVNASFGPTEQLGFSGFKLKGQKLGKGSGVVCKSCGNTTTEGQECGRNDLNGVCAVHERNRSLKSVEEESMLHLCKVVYL